jgi:fructose-bisphosphate aldolase class II
MTVATLSEVLSKAKENHYAVAGLVVLGWEDARCYAETAEELGLPIILQAGPGCRANTPMPVLGKMFRHLAEQSSQPIVCHLDHGYSKEECIEGIENGFTSVMFDGSKLLLNENIEKTHEIAELAHKNDISVEGEIGFVGYNEGAASQSTDPLEAKEFADKSNCDAMAISAGNVHLQTNTSSSIDTDVIEKIQSLTSIH